MNLLISPSLGLSGQIKVAGDKSISHRSIILGAISNGITQVSKILESEDVLATISVFRAMGIRITRSSEDPTDNNYEIEGKGLYGLSQPTTALNLGNSGTAFRLLTGLLSAQPWGTTLFGDASLNKRPMGRIIDPLKLMGADIDSVEGKPPIKISAVDRLDGIQYSTPMASAQVKSAILFAGLYASGTTSVTEPAPTRDHTERMLTGFGYDVDSTERTVSISSGGELTAQTLEVPADLSSAAFFILAGLITPNSELKLNKVGVNPSRSGVLTVLKRMGGQIESGNYTQVGGEPVADIVVKTSDLKGCDVCGEDIALAIDEIPVIAVAAACADGITRISDAKELRVKESDRIRSMIIGLVNLGIQVEELPDGMIIHGGKLTEGQVDSFDDHRIAMAFCIAGAAASGPVEVLNCKNIATSFPDFQQLANQSGVSIVVN